MGASCNGKPEKENKPNILFLFTDDQRFDTIGALGNDEIITPNLDRLAQNGTVFTHAHIPGGTAAAVCMPSRAMLHSGRTLFHLEGEGQGIPTEHTTLGEAFQGAGYRTFGTGKWHNGIPSYARSFTDGGAIFFGGMWDHWNVPVNNYDPTGKYNNIINFTDNFFFNNSPVKIHCDSFSTGKHSTELISDASINFLNGYDEDSPFLMYVSFLAPHDPRTMPQRFKDMYNPDEITLPENFAREHSFDYGVKGIRDEMLAPYPRTPECIKTHIAEYYGMISHLDYEIGRIIKTLEDTGKAENTIIVLAGDNGLALGQHGLMGKQNLYEHSVRVPLIFSGAGIPKGVVTDQYIYLMDIFPTLCDCAGIEIPISVEGKSFYPILMGGREEKRETLYFAYSDLIRGVKDRNHKLIYYNGGADAKPALFDILNDPFETENLFDSPEHEQIVKRLNTALMKYKSEWEDTNHPSSKAFYDSFGEHATANRNGHIEGGTT